MIQRRPQDREEQIRQDVHDLHRLGYAQELFRTMGGFSNFAISFSTISILTGAVILFDYGLAWGGPAATTIGWPIVSIFVLLIAASMAEIASAYPTAGGLYYWVSRLKSKDWGWWTAWFNLAGQITIVAGIDYAAASFVNASIIAPLTNNAYTNSTGILGSFVNGQMLTFVVILVVTAAINIAGVRIVSFLNDLSVWWHIVVVAVIVVALFALGTLHTQGSIFAVTPLDTQAGGATIGAPLPVTINLGPAGGYFIPLAFLFSLLQGQWTYTGYDASAHVAEETVGARLSSAWGIFLSVAVSAVVGWFVLFALITHLPDMTKVFDPACVAGKGDPNFCTAYYGGNPVVDTILTQGLGGLGTLLSAAIAVAMSLCGNSSLAAAGRMLYAFSRDDGLPGSSIFKKVDRRFRTPANATVGIIILSWLITEFAFVTGGATAIAIVTAISTCALYWAYGMPILAGLIGRQEWRAERVWSLGRWSRPIGWFALAWIVVISFLFLWPTSGNAFTLIAMVVFLAFLLVYYFAWARQRFLGPKVMGKEEQLSEIEREFEHAAEDLHGATA